MARSGQKVVYEWISQAKREGWRVEQGKKHFRLYPPDKAIAPITVPSSIGRGRALLNLRADFRRAGLEVQV